MPLVLQLDEPPGDWPGACGRTGRVGAEELGSRRRLHSRLRRGVHRCRRVGAKGVRRYRGAHEARRGGSGCAGAMEVSTGWSAALLGHGGQKRWVAGWARSVTPKGEDCLSPREARGGGGKGLATGSGARAFASSYGSSDNRTAPEATTQTDSGGAGFSTQQSATYTYMVVTQKKLPAALAIAAAPEEKKVGSVRRRGTLARARAREGSTHPKLRSPNDVGGPN